jgi:hypothetical protein
LISSILFLLEINVFAGAHRFIAFVFIPIGVFDERFEEAFELLDVSDMDFAVLHFQWIELQSFEVFAVIVVEELHSFLELSRLEVKLRQFVNEVPEVVAEFVEVLN